MKTIILTQNRVALVDDWNYEWLNQWNWCAVKNHKTYYAIKADYSTGKRRTVWMHRLIMSTPVNLECDHEDHYGLNNQEFNLRNCTFNQNRKNVQPKNGRKYLGVHINRGKYITAHINSNKKSIHLGTFKTEEDAARAYDAKAKELFGEFANLNFKL